MPTYMADASHQGDELAYVEQLLEHLEQLENHIQQVRSGLMHSHRLATLGTVASILAHEFNNILTPIMSYCRLALEEENDLVLLRNAVEKSLSGAQKASHISSSLLGFAREQDQQQAAPLISTVEEAIACLARDPSKDGIEMEISIPDVQVSMSPLNLQQVLVNLVLNAKNAMQTTGGRLAIRGRVERELVHIEVADSGPGIPEEIADRLFEPFVTQRTETEDAGNCRGTGLGLCICRDLIQQAGGSIHVDSHPGKGATFYLTVPKADDLFETT